MTSKGNNVVGGINSADGSQCYSTMKCVEEIEKLAWKNIKASWDSADNYERCRIVHKMMHSPYQWIPKDFIYDVFKWFYNALEEHEIELSSALKYNKDRRLRLVRVEQSERT